jgi:aryl-alcohol dehydrogenase-like predicted oxidoreductase
LKYRPLGRTGLQVSELGFGCGSVGGLLIRGDQREMLSTVEHAIELGVNYFDTASIYGDGKSESNLGAVLQKLGTDVLVGTKVRLTATDMGHIHDAVKESVEGSLKRLEIDCIDLIQLHNPIGPKRDPGRGYVGLDDLQPVMLAFQSLQEQGKVRFYGINGLGETEALLQAVELAGVHSIQTCYNLINPSAGQEVPQGFPFQDFRQLMQKASENGIGVIAIRVLAGGALSGTDHRHPNAAKTVSPIASGRNYADDVAKSRMFRLLVELGYVGSLVEAAIRFVISNSAVSTALVGFSSIEQLDQAAEYVGKGPFPSKALRRIEEIWTLYPKVDSLPNRYS